MRVHLHEDEAASEFAGQLLAIWSAVSYQR